MYLLADIGATNARFQQADENGLLDEVAVFATAEFDQAQTLFHTVNEHYGSSAYQRVVLATAGPMDGDGGIRITNTGLRLTCEAARSAFSADVKLVNDFYALAAGVPHFEHLRQVGGNDARVGANKAILGPGTGLGMAGLVSQGASWQVVSTEGGHMDLAPGNHLEAELWGLLSQSVEHVSWESVLSGPGLVNLYAAMATLWGAKPDALTPAEIVAQGLDAHSPMCHQTLETFAGLLGSAAGNLALMFLARGGIYLAGGITQKLAEFLPNSPLRRRFEERGAMAGMIKDVPLYLVMDDQPGLRGALALAQHPDMD